MTLAHLADVHATLPASQAAVVPGTSQFLVFEKPAIVAGLIREFLADAAGTQPDIC